MSLLVPTNQGSPRQRAVKPLCVCVPNLSQLIIWESVFYLNTTHPSEHSHLCSMKCHLIFFPYRPGLTSMQHAALHMTAVQPPSQSGLVKKYKCARLKFSTTKAGSCQTGETLTKKQWRDSSVLVVAVQSCDVVTHTDNEADCCCARRRHDLGTVRNQLDE